MDTEEVRDLLDIVERTLRMPKLKMIHDTAMAELEDIAEQLKPAKEEPDIEEVEEVVSSGVKEPAPNGRR